MQALSGQYTCSVQSLGTVPTKTGDISAMLAFACSSERTWFVDQIHWGMAFLLERGGAKKRVRKRANFAPRQFQIWSGPYLNCEIGRFTRVLPGLITHPTHILHTSYTLTITRPTHFPHSSYTLTTHILHTFHWVLARLHTHMLHSFHTHPTQILLLSLSIFSHTHPTHLLASNKRAADSCCLYFLRIHGCSCQMSRGSIPRDSQTTLFLEFDHKTFL